MSIHDKIKDRLYVGSDEDLESDLTTSAFSEITDSVRDPLTAIRVLAITIPAEIAFTAVFIFAREKVLDFLSDGEVFGYAALVTFALGFLTVYTVYRLAQQRLDRNSSRPSISSGIMSGYAGHEHRSSKRWIWFISAAAGVLNTLFFFALYSFRLN
jgi:hypothetical protein